MGKIEQIVETNIFGNGPTEEFLGPTLNRYTIRERNGEDEEILSKIKDNQDGTALARFASAILVNPRLPFEEFNKLPLKDKYYIILKSRIQSLGDILKFSHVFEGKDAKPYPFQVDLKPYLWDFSLPMPEVDSKEYFPYRCTPYPKEINDSPRFEGTLSSGKKVRMHYLTGVGETRVLGKNYGDLTINERLRIRDFEAYHKDTWQPMENFRLFTSRDMTEIRALLEKYDSGFDLTMELTHPGTGAIEKVSMLQVDDFFFPKVL